MSGPGGYANSNRLSSSEKNDNGDYDNNNNNDNDLTENLLAASSSAAAKDSSSGGAAKHVESVSIDNDPYGLHHQLQHQDGQQQIGGGGPDTYRITVGDVDGGESGGEKQPDRFRDAGAGALFLIHLMVVVALAAKGVSSLTFQAPRFNGTDTLHLGGVFLIFLVACLASLILTALLVALLTRFAETLVQVALYVVVGSNLLLCAVFLSQQYWLGLLLAGILLLATGCYARSIRRRLPLCSAILSTAMSAIQTNVGVVVLAYGTIFALCLYSILWLLAGIGIYVGSGPSICNDDGSSCRYHLHALIAVTLLMCYAWTARVLTNVLHVTVSGVVATWWFAPDDASGNGYLWSPALHDSLARACTYSFGSVCLASLLTSIVQFAYHVVRSVNRYSSLHSRASLVFCVAQCLLGCLERLVVYFHRYALVYVAGTSIICCA